MASRLMWNSENTLLTLRLWRWSRGPIGCGGDGGGGCDNGRGGVGLTTPPTTPPMSPLSE